MSDEATMMERHASYIPNYSEDYYRQRLATEEAELARIKSLRVSRDNFGEEAAWTKKKQIADTEATIANLRNILAQGNPGEVPLMETLDDLAQFVDYEAEVVETAAMDLPNGAVRTEALGQAEAMEEAAEALQDASEAAAETAAEVFVETGIPSSEQPTDVVAGNPMSDDDLNFMYSHARGYAERAGLDELDPDDYARWFMGRFGGEDELPDVSHRIQYWDHYLPTVEGNPVSQGNAPAVRQEAGQSHLQGTGQAGQRATQAQSYVGTGNPVRQGNSPSANVGVSNRAAGGARNVTVGNPVEDREAETARVRAAFPHWTDEQVAAYVDSLLALQESIDAITDGNPDVPEVLEEAAEDVAERETVTEDEEPLVTHWFFRERHFKRK